MTALRVLMSRLASLFGTRRREYELNEEIQAHLDLLTSEKLRTGMSEADARLAARREFGGVDRIKEIYRDQRGVPVLEAFGQDLRYASRTFRKSPGFAIAVVLSLGLGIGVNSAIFTVLNGLIFQSLPVTNPKELFAARPVGPSGISNQFSYPVFAELRRVGPSLAAMSRVARMYGRTDAEQEARITAVQLVSDDYFSVLGVSAQRGRVFTAADDQTMTAHPVAVISHGFWQRRYAAAQDVVGRLLTLNGTTFTIIGLIDEDFSGVWLESPVDVWTPLMMQSDLHYGQNYSNSGAEPDKPWIPQPGIRWLDIVGRDGGLVSAVEASLNGSYRQTVLREAEAMEDSSFRDRFLQHRLAIEPFGQGFSNLRVRFVPPLYALLGMAAVILLIACANTANLLLARATARQREISVRLSIGASRGRLIRQLLTESLVLAALATAAGLLLAGWSGDLLVRQALGRVGTPPFPVDVDARVIAVTIAVSIGTVMLFGLVPAFRATRLQLGTALRMSSAWGSGRPRLQKFLVGTQVALSLVLLVGAGLFVRTLQNYASLAVGYSQEQIVSVWINPHAAGFSTDRLRGLYIALVDRLEAIPGVDSASVAMCGLASSCQTVSGIVIDRYVPQAGEHLQLQENRIGPNYFATTGMRLVEGRTFDDHDSADGPKVAVVNRAMVRRFFPDGNALGRRFGYDTPDTEIVGVVEDARVNRIQQPPAPMAFYPMAQQVVDAGTVDVRALGDPRSIASEVRKVVSAVDTNLPVDRVTILSDQVASGLNQERLIAGLTTLFGGLALALACCGLFGVMSYTVSRRTTEFGLRIALGARPSNVLTAVFRESFAVVAVGLVVGAPMALGVARLFSTLVFGVSGTDPGILAVAVMLLVLVTALASLLPAWRASRVDPMVALRCE